MTDSYDDLDDLDSVWYQEAASDLGRFWETFAMEWKTRVGWIAPFLATAVAFVALRYGERLVADVQVRKLRTNLFAIAFAIAMIVVVGPLVNVAAPDDFMHRAYHL